MVLRNWKLKLLPGHLGIFMLLSQQAEKEIPLLGGVIDSGFKGNFDFCCKMEEKKDHVWNPGDSLRCPLVLPFSGIPINEILWCPIKTKPPRSHQAKTLSSGAGRR